MERRRLNSSEGFQEAVNVYSQELQAAVDCRRKEMDAAWSDIDTGWANLRARMTALGIRSAEASESMLRLNVGGAPIDVWRSSLCSPTSYSRLGALFEGVWDKRLPKLANGRILLDESPSCFKRLLRKNLGIIDEAGISTERRGSSTRVEEAYEDDSYGAYLENILFAIPRHVKETSLRPSRQSVSVADLHSFGSAIADCLGLERRMLDDATGELRLAEARLGAAHEAIEVIYGPQVTEGSKDTVVELNVRGSIFATMRSTLQACADSALYRRFDEERWPPQEGELDKDGRYLVECSPLCFSKVLDILRIRKRAAWARAAQSSENGCGSSEFAAEQGAGSVLLYIPETHREGFNALVNMYFPGCENFITDFVEHAQKEAW